MDSSIRLFVSNELLNLRLKPPNPIARPFPPSRSSSHDAPGGALAYLNFRAPHITNGPGINRSHRRHFHPGRRRGTWGDGFKQSLARLRWISWPLATRGTVSESMPVEEWREAQFLRLQGALAVGWFLPGSWSTSRVETALTCGPAAI